MFADANLSATLQAEIWSSDHKKIFVPVNSTSPNSAFLTATVTKVFLATWTFVSFALASFLKFLTLLWVRPL